jgi:hypothetical protein
MVFADVIQAPEVISAPALAGGRAEVLTHAEWFARKPLPYDAIFISMTYEFYSSVTMPITRNTSCHGLRYSPLR